MTQFRYKFRPKGDIILLDVSPMPDWQEFGDFVQEFLSEQGARLIEQDMGMDRHQVRYRLGQKQYVLQFEHYCESIWIEEDY